MPYDSAGSLFALGMRATKLDVLGVPIVGTDTCYVSDSLIAVSIGLEYEEGTEVNQKSGSGRVCLTYRAPDTLKRGTISDFSVCSPDPNVLEFMIGGEVISTGAATAEVQTVTITGTPTGGTFTLTFDGETTADIDFDATNAEVDTALEALPNIAVGEVTVTGGPGPGAAFTVTFATSVGNVPQMTADGSGLTGGTAPDVTVTTTTPGNNLTDVGYRAPEVGAEAVPNGISLEFWTRAIDEGAFASQLPYFHWVLPRAKVRPSDAWTLSGENPLLPGFQGWSEQNANWGSGPAEDWPYESDRVWQFARVAAVPTLSPGFVTVS
jgi:hypothetical protein